MSCTRSSCRPGNSCGPYCLYYDSNAYYNYIAPQLKERDDKIVDALKHINVNQRGGGGGGGGGGGRGGNGSTQTINITIQSKK